MMRLLNQSAHLVEVIPMPPRALGAPGAPMRRNGRPHHLVLRESIPAASEHAESAASGEPKGSSATVRRATGCMTAPQIFLTATDASGSDDIHALERASKLDALLGRGDALAGPDDGRAS